MPYCSLQHWTLLPSPVTSTTGCCFWFGSVSSFFLISFSISPWGRKELDTNERRSCSIICSDKTWSTGEGNGKPCQYSCLENPTNTMKRQKDRTLKDELPRSVGAQYAAEDQWRNNSRKNEETEPKQKQHPVVDVTGDRSKVQCCKERYCIGTWNAGPRIKANWKWSNKKWQE